MALEKSLSYVHPHPIYRVLHSNAIQRQAAYRRLFSSQVEGKLLEAIRVNSNMGMAIGNEQFKQEIEALTGRRMKGKKMGRPANP
jgi:putative transposase